MICHRRALFERINVVFARGNKFVERNRASMTVKIRKVSVQTRRSFMSILLEMTREHYRVTSYDNFDITRIKEYIFCNKIGDN